MSAPTVRRQRPAKMESVFRGAARLVLILACALLAFWPSLVSVYSETVAGTLIGYVFALPPLAAIAANGIARRPHRELPIHDRQTDVIVGCLVLGLALLIKAVLVQRYFRQFELLRLDLLALFVFLLGASVMLFGLRPAARYLPVWILLITMFPLPYVMIVIALGGTAVSAGAVVLPLAAFATAISVRRTPARARVGAALTVLVGASALGLLALLWPAAPLVVFQVGPALTGAALVATSMYAWRRRAAPRRRIPISPDPLTARAVTSGAALAAACAIALAVVPLPHPEPSPIVDLGDRPIDSPLPVPAGWVGAEDAVEFPWARRFFGPRSVMYRQHFVQLTGERAYDVFARPRTVMVDSVTTDRPLLFTVYPTNLLYDVSSMRVSRSVAVDLGHRMTGSLYSVVDDDRMLTWTALVFAWHNESVAQRITLMSVDNHEADGYFPVPEDSLLANLNVLFTMFFRGSHAVLDAKPTFKDADLLTGLARGLIIDQLGLTHAA